MFLVVVTLGTGANEGGDDPKMRMMMVVMMPGYQLECQTHGRMIRNLLGPRSLSQCCWVKNIFFLRFLLSLEHLVNTSQE